MAGAKWLKRAAVDSARARFFGQVFHSADTGNVLVDTVYKQNYNAARPTRSLLPRLPCLASLFTDLPYLMGPGIEFTDLFYRKKENFEYNKIYRHK